MRDDPNRYEALALAITSASTTGPPPDAERWTVGLIVGRAERFLEFLSARPDSDVQCAHNDEDRQHDEDSHDDDASSGVAAVTETAAGGWVDHEGPIPADRLTVYNHLHRALDCVEYAPAQYTAERGALIGEILALIDRRVNE